MLAVERGAHVCVLRKRRAHRLSAASAIVSLLFAFFSYVDHTTATAAPVVTSAQRPLTPPDPPFPHRPAVRSGAPDRWSVAAVSRVEWIASCGPASSFACHVHTHTHTRARAPHTVVRENPTPAAAIVNQWDATRVSVLVFTFVSLNRDRVVDRRSLVVNRFTVGKFFNFKIIIAVRTRIRPSPLSRPRAPPCAFVRSNLGRVALVVFPFDRDQGIILIAHLTRLPSVSKVPVPAKSG